MSATQATENRTLNVAPGSLVRVRDADWLVTNASPTQDVLLVEVIGLSGGLSVGAQRPETVQARRQVGC